MGHVLHPSFLDPTLSFSVVLEGATISIDTRTVEQFSETPFIFRILSTHWGKISYVPMTLFLPKGRNIIQQSWIIFCIHLGAAITNGNSTLRGIHLVSSLLLLLLLSYGGDLFLLWGFFLLILIYCIYMMYVVMGVS